MKSHTRPITRRAPLLALFAASLLPFALHAQTDGTWTNTAGGTWGTASNWETAPASGTGATADFSTLNITANETVTLDGSYTVGHLIFADTSGSSTWTIAGNSSNILTLASTGTPTITATTAATISAPLQGSQGFLKNGAGTLTINSGANTFNTLSGPIEVAAGTLAFGSMDSVVNITSAITVDSGATLNIFGNYQSGTMANDIVLNSGGTFAVNGNAFYKGHITLNGDATITHNGNNGTIGAGTITGNHTLTLQATYGGQPDLTVNAAIQTGTGGLIVKALNTQQIVLGSNNNTYTGATTVQTGLLIVTGKLTSAVTVNSGATFGGTGSSTQDISVLSGGFITGGGVAGVGATGAVGTFTTTGAITLASGSTFTVDFNSGTGAFDKLVASGFSLNGATLSLNDLGSSTLALGQTYTIMDGSESSVADTFAGLAEGSRLTVGGNTFQISYLNDDVTLTTVNGAAIPEPASWAALLGGVAALAAIVSRRRSRAPRA